MTSLIATTNAKDAVKPYEILASVFGPVEKRKEPFNGQPLKTLDDTGSPTTHAHFKEVAEDVRAAIRQGIQPKLNKAGSSGSYFARSTAGKTVGIFKPKGEPNGRCGKTHIMVVIQYIARRRTVWISQS